jgi:hypothetical protein
LWIELSQSELERLDAASGELGAQALVRAVVLSLADRAYELRADRLRASLHD